MAKERPMTGDDCDMIRVEIPGTNRAIGISMQLLDHFPANDIWKEIVDFPGIQTDMCPVFGSMLNA